MYILHASYVAKDSFACTRSRLAFKGLCSGGGGSDNVQLFFNTRLRSRQKMPLPQRSEAILLSVIKHVKYLYFAHQMCPFVIPQECSFAEH